MTRNFRGKITPQKCMIKLSMIFEDYSGRKKWLPYSLSTTTTWKRSIIQGTSGLFVFFKYGKATPIAS